MRIIGLPSVVNKSSKVIILGSMPGAESLRIRQYYGHPRNQFWEIMKRLLKQKSIASYVDKKRMVFNNGIALWDVIHSCKRDGSLDANLRDIKVNDFKRFIKRHPNIRAVFCNGQTAFRLFNRHCGYVDLPVLCLPSTSPAHSIPVSNKLRKWKKVLRFL